MDLETIKIKLKSKEYDFLRTKEHLGNNIMLLTLGGSYAYGTNIETSDLDIRGIAGNRPQELLGISNFDQFINEATDTTIYSLKKMVKLLLNCNPNTIEILGTKPEHIFILTEEGKLLRDNVDLFLSQKCIYSFGGYAKDQLKRLQNSLDNNTITKPHERLYKHAMHLIRLYLMVLDILEGKGINTYRENDIGLLMDIRNGKYKFDEVFEMVNEYEDRLDYTKQHTSLPIYPNVKRVEELVMEINARCLVKSGLFKIFDS